MNPQGICIVVEQALGYDVQPIQLIIEQRPFNIPLAIAIKWRMPLCVEGCKSVFRKRLF